MTEKLLKAVEIVLADYKRQLEIVKKAKLFSLNEWYINSPKQAYIEEKISFFNSILDKTEEITSVRKEVSQLDEDVLSEIAKNYGLDSEEKILLFGFEFWLLILDGLVEKQDIFTSWNRILGKFYEEAANV